MLKLTKNKYYVFRLRNATLAIGKLHEISPKGILYENTFRKPYHHRKIFSTLPLNMIVETSGPFETEEEAEMESLIKWPTLPNAPYAQSFDIRKNPKNIRNTKRKNPTTEQNIKDIVLTSLKQTYPRLTTYSVNNNIIIEVGPKDTFPAIFKLEIKRFLVKPISNS